VTQSGLVQCRIVPDRLSVVGVKVRPKWSLAVG